MKYLKVFIPGKGTTENERNVLRVVLIEGRQDVDKDIGEVEIKIFISGMMCRRCGVELRNYN